MGCLETEYFLGGGCVRGCVCYRVGLDYGKSWGWPMLSAVYLVLSWFILRVMRYSSLRVLAIERFI